MQNGFISAQIYLFCGINGKNSYICTMKIAIRKYLLLIILCCTTSYVGMAQDILWNADFDFRFDNREYGDPSKMIAPSETLFGANMRPEIGLGWGYGHSLMLGTTLPADMGSEKFMGTPELLAYYAYDGEKFSASLGLFPRKRLRGRYSYAFFSDSYRFYKPTIEGMLIQYGDTDWFVELGCDWNGLRSKTRREMFTIIFAGEARKGFSYAGYTATLHHHASSDSARGVVDNGLADIYVGLDLSSIWYGVELSFQAGWIQSYQNDRLHIGSPVMPGGYELEIKMKRNDLGLIDTFYKGEDLMPYWSLPYEDGAGGIYGENLYFGDPFYRVGDKGFYNRFELYWEPELNEGVNLRISSVHHFDGNHWGWQQVVSLAVYIGSEMFAPIR